jgi:hypothetical protein
MGTGAERTSGEVYGEPLVVWSLSEVMRVSKKQMLRWLGKKRMLLSA